MALQGLCLGHGLSRANVNLLFERILQQRHGPTAL
eukprot:CAMPEP_0181432826 /NCGR_PEP_ID=MMETSP1110-20121109/18971_1 /TAXON_ID=174948 /ORGANISM="Symbiodinium sp., Strain CCMP421" /LENGTH=34 /DNA_ID= /DNA_START= /DNA_END= /DNA_ORIENTATION=